MSGVPQSSRSSTALPTYQSPLAPLNDGGKRALARVCVQNGPTAREEFHKAAEMLSETAGEVIDCLYNAQKRRKKNLQKGDEDAYPTAEDVEQLKTRVEELTRNLEAGVRKAIDAQAGLAGREQALKDICANVERGAASTQSTLGASQWRSSRRAGADGDTEGGENSEDGPIGILTTLKKKTQESDESYGKLSMRLRYAEHNEYVNFKKLVHDAHHPFDQAPPVPHASTWFPREEGEDAAEIADTNAASSQRARVAATYGVAEEEDSDIEIQAEKTDLKCPLTRLPFKEPMSSKKCPHTFERKDILELIQNSRFVGGASGRRGPQNGEKEIDCPVCTVTLTADDLYYDAVMARKVKRMQARASGANDINADPIGSSDDEERPARRNFTSSVKKE